MKNSLIKLLSLVSVMLLGLLLLEWFWLNHVEEDKAIIQPASMENQIRLPDSEFTQLPFDNYQEIVMRPLFIEGRRPIEGGSDDDSIAAISNDIKQFALMGVYTIENKLIALIKDQTNADHYLKKSVGDEIAGWTIKQILTDRIIIERSGQTQEIELRKPKPRKLKSIKHPFRLPANKTGRRLPTKPNPLNSL
ncbi:hypothetical protein [methane-oxidizing endosymbiont of Gigantopelta aegis]|uniref:hypothetical protein n=1 Tax=methane-oxidizing endosymbiont of Gigantopelta aegis TaxID=2794938 RepID=UPI0018DD93E6|nr:hypothetical protein [methane-oxidizing endosymbiont of Gigantopelta aegis]